MSLTERLERLEIKLYQRTVEEDYLMASLWDELNTRNEITKLVTRTAYNLSGFLSLLQPPNVAIYTKVFDTIESLHWAEPVNTSDFAVYFSSWYRSSGRGTKHHAYVMSTIYEMMFSLGKKTIIGVTKQGKLLNLHRKIGYTVLKPIPNLFDHEQAWVMYLTEPAFKAGSLYRVANRQRIKLDAAA